MRRNLWLTGAAVAVAAGLTVALVARFNHTREQQRFALFAKYCTDCHNAADFAGNLSFGPRDCPKSTIS